MTGTWTHEEIGGKPAHVFQPAGGMQPRFGALFLHPVGNETLHDNAVYTRVLGELGLACVSPLAPFTWWNDRICPGFDASLTAEQHILSNVLPFFTSRWGLKPRAIGLFGISMGGQGALRLAFRHPRVFPVAAGIASAIDYHEFYDYGASLGQMYDSTEQCRQDTVLMHIHPSEFPPHIFFAIDPEDADWYRGNDRLHEKLNALGIEHKIDFDTTAGGHTWDYFNRMAEPALRFVFDGLVTESRRLL